MQDAMAGIEMVKFSLEPSSLPPSPSPVLAKPDISLHQAARDGREDVLREWMAVDKSGVDARDSEGYTAFHYAAENHHLNVMSLLVDNGADYKLLADVDEDCYTGQYGRYTALHLAAAGGGAEHKPGEQESQAVKETMTYLVEIGLDVNNQSIGSNEKCPLHIACSSGCKAAVEFLLDQENIRLDLVDRTGSSILHTLCATSNVELLQLVLEKLKEKGQLSDMLIRESYYVPTCTPLYLAFCNGHLQMASKLLEFASKDDHDDIDPQLVLDSSQGMESDAIVEFFRMTDSKWLSRQSDGATILHQVVERGWARAAREIAVKEPSLLNEKDNHGCTPLHYAAGKNNWEIVDLLMNQESIHVDVADKDGCTPLLVAARQGCTEAFARLLRKADLKKMDGKGKIALVLAAEADQSAILEAAKGKDPGIFRQACGDGVTPLHAAAASGSEKAMKVLLEQRVDVNACNRLQQTPLHLAALKGHNGVVKMLLARSDVVTDEQLATSDISAGDKRSSTALHLAAGRGHCSVAVTLLSKGASVRARNEHLETPLHYAARGGKQEMVELLISKHHAEVDVRAEGQLTPLHWAAYCGHPDVVTTLLQHDADLTAVDESGVHALDYAIKMGHSLVAMAILKHDEWEDAMHHTHELDKGLLQQTTPMRELIKKMPEVAVEVLNKCTQECDPDPRTVDYQVTYDYTLLEDLRKPGDSDRSPEEVCSNASVSPPQSGWNYRPSQLFKRLPRLKREGLYTDWGPIGFDVATHPLMLMVQNKRTELLNHPLVTTFIAYKWKRAWPLYLANVLFYLVFLSFFTAYALVVPNPQSELCVAVSNHTFANTSVECGNGSNATAILCGECGSNQPFLYAAGAIVLLCVLVRVIMEFIQFLEQPAHYFFSRENWLEIFLYSFTLIFMSSLGGTCECPKPWQWQIGALAVFLAWIQLSIFVRKLPQLGLYIIMFEGIVITFIKIAIPALLLVLAFSFAFYMMFFVPSPLFAASPFATPGLSIIKAMTMAVGEMEFESIFRLNPGGVSDIDEVPTPIPYTGVSNLLWIFFLILMPILLMNLLTGLAVGDVEKIQSDAECRKRELQIGLVLKTEEAFQVIRTWFIPPSKRSFDTPNKHPRRQRFLSLLAGVDKNLTGEDIHKSLSNNSRHIEIEHVHEQTTTLLAKLDKQGTESSDQRKDISELKTELAHLRAEQKVEMTQQKAEVVAMRAAMAEQRAMMEKLLELCSAGGREEGRASLGQS